MKKVLKELIIKLPVFLFCIVFIKGYEMLFGAENSIIGVVILIGLFIYLKNDFDIKSYQAVMSIPVLYMILIVGSKVSLINPFIGIAVNFVSLSFMLIIPCFDIEKGNHVPLLMGYIFCQGYDVSGEVFSLRVVSIFGASLLIAGIYFLVHRKKASNLSIIDLFKSLSIHSEKTQWYIKIVTILTAVMFVGDLLNYPRSMWIALTVLSLTTPLHDDHKERRRARIPAAILGAAAFYIIFEILVPVNYQMIVVMIASFAAMFITNYFIKSIYNSFSALWMAVLMLPTGGAMAIRIISNIIGTIVASISYFVFDRVFDKTTDRAKLPYPTKKLENS